MANEQESCAMGVGEREPPSGWYFGICQPWESYNNKRLGCHLCWRTLKWAFLGNSPSKAELEQPKARTGRAQFGAEAIKLYRSRDHVYKHKRNNINSTIIFLVLGDPQTPYIGALEHLQQRVVYLDFII
jgi:hypothetical protein